MSGYETGSNPRFQCQGDGAPFWYCACVLRILEWFEKLFKIFCAVYGSMGEEDIVTTVLSEIISSKSKFHLNSHTGFSSTVSYNNEQNKGKVLLSWFISVVTIDTKVTTTVYSIINNTPGKPLQQHCRISSKDSKSVLRKRHSSSISRQNFATIKPHSFLMKRSKLKNSFWLCTHQNLLLKPCEYIKTKIATVSTMRMIQPTTKLIFF